jgi:hypothetical protein
VWAINCRGGGACPHQVQQRGDAGWRPGSQGGPSCQWVDVTAIGRGPACARHRQERISGHSHSAGWRWKWQVAAAAAGQELLV